MPHEVLSPVYERRDQRGVFREVLNSYQWGSLITGCMQAGAVMGNHYHKETMLFFYLTSGNAAIETVDVETFERDCFAIQANQGVMLKTYESHAIRFLEDSGFIMLKSQPYRPEAPDIFEFAVSG